jgi:hypothetical protein
MKSGYARQEIILDFQQAAAVFTVLDQRHT